MRNILMSFAVIAGLGAGAVAANAAPVQPAVAGSSLASSGLVQTVQYYGYRPHHPYWHHHEWRREHWLRHHAWYRHHGFYR